MPQVKFTQYSLPNGERSTVYYQVSDMWYKRAMDVLKDEDLSFEVERLRNGDVSMTLTHKDEGDLVGETCPHNPLAIHDAVEHLIDKAYNLVHYEEQ